MLHIGLSRGGGDGVHVFILGLRTECHDVELQPVYLFQVLEVMPMNGHKRYAVAAVTIFILILSAPLLFFNHDSTKISLVENKALAKTPSIFNETGGINTGFLKEFESWINDNLGFREESVVLNIALNYKLFRKISIPLYVLGKEEHLYYMSNFNILKYQGKDVFADATLNGFAQNVQVMREYFQAWDVPFLMMMIPDKEQIYPEYFPSTVYRSREESVCERFVRYLRDTYDMDAFYIKDALLEKKNEMLLWYKNLDPTHWNGNGAFVGYTELMKKIKNIYPDIKILTMEDVDIEEIPERGTLAHLKPIRLIDNMMDFHDTRYAYRLKDEPFRAQVSTVPPEGVKVEQNAIYFHYHNPENTRIVSTKL
jgi:hypothetical protein